MAMWEGTRILPVLPLTPSSGTRQPMKANSTRRKDSDGAARSGPDMTGLSTPVSLFGLPQLTSSVVLIGSLS